MARHTQRAHGQKAAGSALTGVDGTDRRPAASLDSGRVATSEERRIGDCEIAAEQRRQARVRQQSEARTEQDRCYTAAQYLGEAPCESARSAGGRSPLGRHGPAGNSCA